MELFFIESPIGILQVLIKEKKLYSISNNSKNFLEIQIKNLNLKDNRKSKKTFSVFTSDIKNLNKKASYLFNYQKKKFFKQKTLSPIAQNIKNQLHLFFKGRLKTFQIPLYDRGTEFQKKVWKAIKQIPYGKIKTYSQTAESIKNQKAYRVIGNCCSKNPFLIVIPCHRVVSKTGLGGFALGLKIKEQLLKLEKEFCSATGA